MFTDDAYYESSEFKEILGHYKSAPTMLDADDLTEVADYYLGLGDEKASGEAISLALQMYPDAAAPLAFKTREALENSDCEEAERLFSLIGDKTSDDYSMLKGEILIAKEQDKEAAALFEEMERKCLYDYSDFMDHEDLVIEVANIYSNYGLFEEAAKWVDKCEDREDPDYLELRARSLIGMNKPEEAVEAANQLIDIDAFSKRSWHILASAQFGMGDYEESMASCDYALAIDPDYGPCLYMKANCLFNTGEFEEAIDYYRRSRSIERGDSWLHLNEGTCLLNMGRYHEAVEKLQEAERSAQTDGGPLGTIYKELAFAFGADGQSDKAIECLSKAEAENDDPIELGMLRGHILLQAGQYDEALSIFIEIMEKTNREPQTLLRIAVSLYDNKHYKTSYIFFQILFTDTIDNDDFVDGYSYMALCCQALGKAEEFFKYLVLAVKYNPREAQAVLSDYVPNDIPPEELSKMMQDAIDNASEKFAENKKSKKGKKDKNSKG